MFVCMCLFSIEIQTVGQITMARGGPGGDKFLGGSKVPLEPQPCILVKTLSNKSSRAPPI